MDKLIWGVIIFGLPIIIFSVGFYSYAREKMELSPLMAMLYATGMLIVFAILGYIFNGSECISRPGSC